MAVDVAKFRTDYPAFADVAVFPDSALTFWLGIAYDMLNADRWGKQLDLGAELFTAHHLAVEARANAEAVNGDIPGTTTGPVNSKSADKVSIGFDVSAGIQPDAGHWNLTIYGTRFIRICRMMGAGPLFVGVGAVPVGSGMAWSGPLTTPGMSNFG